MWKLLLLLLPLPPPPREAAETKSRLLHGGLPEAGLGPGEMDSIPAKSHWPIPLELPGGLVNCLSEMRAGNLKNAQQCTLQGILSYAQTGVTVCVVSHQHDSETREKDNPWSKPAQPGMFLGNFLSQSHPESLGQEVILEQAYPNLLGHLSLPPSSPL